ncbi:DUF445 family protein [Leptolyngbya sp. 7M]|uniref:DUF445 family protein n=1 Tax=Leptolyngbya sp. 7M TaxID=2812896 RepID=UPI001B8AB180|nr:DUF445 family protein [Leptolyngbya sp. 7M]QYO65906.1 DUF445 domain-containing protein [Leptolyngbya sp. 7M]
MEFFNELANSIAPWFKDIRVQVLLLVVFATVHGWLAAWLAVRMLFRPRRPFKVFGITLFPQGMIPRHRDRLANAIGKAVGEELVSQETIMDELVGKDFLRTKIRGVIDSYTQDLLAQNYPSLVETLPPNLRGPVLDAISSLQFTVAKHIERVLQNEETRSAISSFVERRVDEVLSRRVSAVIDDDAYEKLLGFIESRIRKAIDSPEIEKNIREFVNRRIDDLVTANTPIGEMFTAEAVELLKEKAAEQITPITHHLTEIAAEERTRSQIGALIKKEVHQYYENLPFFKKIFVSRENLLKEVDDLVNESLPKRIEETLKGDVFAAEAGSFIDRSIDNAMRRPLIELLGKIDPEQLSRFKEQVASAIFKLLRGPEMERSISGYVKDLLEKLRPHSIDSILRTVHPESEAKLKDMLSRGLLAIIAGENTSRLVNDMLSKQIESLLAAPIGRLSDKIEEEKLVSASETFADTIIAAIREKLPEAIKEFDVGGVVREKIKNYPVEKLEALVLSVAKEHLRTIELFGAGFGLAIGIVQGALLYFREMLQLSQ